MPVLMRVSAFATVADVVLLAVFGTVRPGKTSDCRDLCREGAST